jgi:pectinesterase
MNSKLVLNLLILFLGIQSLNAQTVTYPLHFTVAQDGSGDFKTIQEAVNATKDLAQLRITINIKNGTYAEKLIIPSWKTGISLIGESKEKTIITNGDFTGKPVPRGKDIFGKLVFNTFTSYTVLVQGNEFRAENLTIVNSAGPVGQAVALHVEADKAVFKNCSLLGNQDTLYAATTTSRQYYEDCYIEGTTDFIFGEATVLFEYCTVKSLSNSYITAAATSAAQPYGFVFMDCKLIHAPAATKVYLGRPWRAHAKTVFLRTTMAGHIIPEGWDNWRDPSNEKTVYYREYQSSGAGAEPEQRVKWAKQLSDAEAKEFTQQNIFHRYPDELNSRFTFPGVELK